MTEPQLVFVDSDDEALIARAYESVLRPSFDSTELPDRSSIQPTRARRLLVALDGAEVVAGAVFETIRHSDIALLSYMASRPAQRSQGLGTLVLGALRKRWSTDSVVLVLAEVRDPRVWSTSDDERPADRLRFYGRNNCQLVPVPWVQPAMEAGPREAGLLLLAVHGVEVGTQIETARLTNWAEHYYAETEGRVPTDAQYNGLIDALSAAEVVEVLPVEAYPSVPLL